MNIVKEVKRSGVSPLVYRQNHTTSLQHFFSASHFLKAEDVLTKTFRAKNEIDGDISNPGFAASGLRKYTRHTLVSLKPCNAAHARAIINNFMKLDTGSYSHIEKKR